MNLRRAAVTDWNRDVTLVGGSLVDNLQDGQTVTVHVSDSDPLHTVTQTATVSGGHWSLTVDTTGLLP